MPQRAQRLEKIIPKNYPDSELTREIISSAIEVHSILGPGLLENVYEEALCHEFKIRNIPFERQKEIKLSYKGHSIGLHRLDLVVNDKVILELKAVNELNKIYEAQIISYLKATGLQVGLLINFNAVKLKEGIKRFIN
jgi:GxxExxY protein